MDVPPQLAHPKGVLRQEQDIFLIEKCVNGTALFDKIVAVRKKAHEEFGVDSTPTFFVNGKRLKGSAVRDFDAAISAARYKGILRMKPGGPHFTMRSEGLHITLERYASVSAPCSIIALDECTKAIILAGGRCDVLRKLPSDSAI